MGKKIDDWKETEYAIAKSVFNVIKEQKRNSTNSSQWCASQNIKDFPELQEKKSNGRKNFKRQMKYRKNGGYESNIKFSSFFEDGNAEPSA